MPSDLLRRPDSSLGDEADTDPRARWNVDGDVMASLRLGAASDALVAGEPDRALAEAELLLSRTPNDMHALLVVGRAAVRTGDGLMARGALEAVVEAQPELGEAWALLALARVLTADPEAGVEAALRATQILPDDALAWHHLAVAYERDHRAALAEDAAAQAERLSPQVFARPRAWTEDEWRRALTAARGLLPEPVLAWYERVPLVWGSFPATALLQTSMPPLSPFIDAHLELPPAPPSAGAQDPHAAAVLPRAVVLYRANLSRPACALDGLARRIALALVRQADAWLHIDG